ncbi:hypothetical protein [Psychroflexus planctonicus]|uniref:Uncharacterized protein n=1 Tax=Psychroflexus planctonicus TaxID=1526575 RepID=A0ABQ1SL49_9FLAO|nr:hypothetical protein [Psychroflexus planctonicus]GGE45298.1 hypothetical protein GCM10010832_26540 [Psychroflexus planctonicus]
MKRRLLSLVVILLFCNSIWAQVGIGTTNPNAALDVVSSNEGLLIPRIALSATNVETLITPTVSELVYNTNISSAGPNQVTPGFYYWDGSLWIRLNTSSLSSTSVWNLNGNSDTNPSTNFIGTTDATGLSFKTNNTERVHITATGNIGVSTVNPGAKLEVFKNETTTDAPVARFNQKGTGHGINVEMDDTTGANTAGITVWQDGAGYGEYINMQSSNANPALALNHEGSGTGLDNIVASGNGIVNTLGSNNTSIINDLSSSGGTGNYTYLGAEEGTGSYVLATDNPTTPSAGSGGDVFAYFGEVKTATSISTSNTVWGAVYAGTQYGGGLGMWIRHEGSAGNGAQFNTINPNNAYATLFSYSEGQGSAILGINNSNTLPSQISVADFSYTGTNIKDHIAVKGESAPSTGWGIGMLGTGGFYGVFSSGDFGSTGTKTFVIDHPEDPANKMLKHFSIESNEVLNMYRGVVKLDSNGEATLELPEYFDLININFSYQLTAIGTSQNPYVLQEIEANQFKVGGAPDTKVSWTIYANRNDAYMQQNPEKGKDVVEKEGHRKGKYLSPELYGQPESAGMFYNEKKTNKKVNTKINIPESIKNNAKNIKDNKRKPKIKPTSGSGSKK